MRSQPGLIGKDLDYAVAQGDAFTLAKELASVLEGHFVALDEANDTARIVLTDGTTLDFAGCVGGSIQSDIKRRDFSMNALFWDPENPELINDFVGGADDIAGQSIRAVNENVLLEDPLRILRAYRFAVTLDFKIEAKTLTWLAYHNRRLREVAAERVNHELFTIFAGRKTSQLLLDMGANGVLETIFPELEATRKVTGNAFHHLALFEHSVEAVVQAERALTERPEWTATNLDEELSFGVTRLAATKLACLLHDIGKPDTWVITPEGKHTFIGHDRLGAEMASVIGERQKWPRPVERFIAKMVKWHLRPGQLFHQGEPTQKAIYRFYRNIGRDLPELILLALGDLGATCGPMMQGEKSASLRASLFELLDGYDVFSRESQRSPKLIDGTELMRLLSLKPGPLVGELLDALEEAQEFKEVSNRAEAERFVTDLYQQKRQE
jgi:putative nucleotidyltransferase with HDIG domain